MKRALLVASLLILAGCNSHHDQVDHPTYTYDHGHRVTHHHYVHVVHHVTKTKKRH